jgi:hypothetical protein
MGRRPLVPGSKEKLDQLKAEFAKENSIDPNDNNYNGDTTSKSNGYVGGSVGGLMTKKMVEEFEKSLVSKK